MLLKKTEWVSFLYQWNLILSLYCCSVCYIYWLVLVYILKGEYHANNPEMSKLLHKAVRQKSQSAFSVYQQYLANRPVNVIPGDPTFLLLKYILLHRLMYPLFISGSPWSSWIQEWSCCNSCGEGWTCFVYCAKVLHWGNVTWSYFQRNSWSNCNCHEQIRWKIKFWGRWRGNIIISVPV